MQKICGVHFFCFWTEKPFLYKSGQKKLQVYAEIWYQNWFEYAEFNDDVHFFSFWPEILFGKFGPKKQNCQFKLKIGT